MQTIRKNRVPTNAEIIEEIKTIDSYKQFLESLLQLNYKGKELAMIYLLGISQLEKYRKKVW